MKSAATAFETVNLVVQWGPPRPPDGVGDQVREFTYRANDYGYTNDGEWHSLTIPFADLELQGFDPTSVRSPLIFSGGGGTNGEQLLVDNVYMQ